MSSTYYKIKSPINKIDALKISEKRVMIRLLGDDNFYGLISLNKEAVNEFVMLFADKENPPAVSYHGGENRGLVVTVLDVNLPDDSLLIEDTGYLITVGDLKKLDGIGRKINDTK